MTAFFGDVKCGVTSFFPSEEQLALLEEAGELKTRRHVFFKDGTWVNETTKSIEIRC